MIMKFATKRNVNGNRHYLIFDTEAKQYAMESSRWFCREDFAEIGLKDLHKLMEVVKSEGYMEVDYM